MSRNALSPGDPDFGALFASCERSAVHVELRDVYALDEEDADFAAWFAGQVTDEDEAARESEFLDHVAAAAARGVALRRVRVVSEPISRYVRYEHAATTANVRAGEHVRWLSRANAWDLLMPALDCWIFDGSLLLLHHFDGDGRWRGHEFSNVPEVVKLYAEAFEQLWERGTPHAEYAVD
ncbi:MAG: hypothetical protein HOV68_24465 [Streptomycetaceae bacterium]|nr:hypothetical protein [Streptomycetaceae bacterium]